MPEFDFMSSFNADGQIRSSAQGRLLGSFAVMPAASALNENAIVLYTGTTGTYVSGQFYMCVNAGSGYEWQTVTISGTEEDTYTADRALVTNSHGQVTASGITAAELGYLTGATSPLQAQINGKVTAVSGMGLSQNSYTTTEKNKLAGIAAGAQVNVIEAVQRNGSAVPVSGKTVNISVPVALSELTNDEGFIDATVENLANFYTKSEVNSMVSAIPKFAVQVVSVLPSSGQSITTIYLTPNSGSGGNIYDEYLWVNSQWEKIGSTQVSFTLDQDGNSIVINGTTLKDASSTSAGLMSITSYNDLQTAKSNISSLQSGYSTLNGTVSGLNSRLTTAESTLSTTVSQVSTLDGRVTTCENNTITGGAFSNGIITLTKALGNISISGIPTEDDMQSIAEEVVSSSGGGGKYITSGFSNYIGHSAIGIGLASYNPTTPANPTGDLMIGIGILKADNSDALNVDGPFYYVEGLAKGNEDGVPYRDACYIQFAQKFGSGASTSYRKVSTGCIVF